MTGLAIGAVIVILVLAVVFGTLANTRSRRS